MGFPIYYLTMDQIKGIANIIYHEQSTTIGRCAEASQIANRVDMKGDEHATYTNIEKLFKSGWYADGWNRYKKGTSNKECITIVKKVFCCGYRTLPRYIDEHDYMGDLKTVKNGRTSVIKTPEKWIPHETVITNKMGGKYTFYDFPGGYKTGVDPFGYTSNKLRKELGETHYKATDIVKKKVSYPYAFPTLPPRGWYKLDDGITAYASYRSQIKRLQRLVSWITNITLKIDGMYGRQTEKAVEKMQDMFGITDNGKFGILCLNKAKSYRLT